MEVKVVIGSNYGDEGKGLMTDYFCQQAKNAHQSSIVVCQNGGAQRGHAVKLIDGTEHVFHHFGSGTMAQASTFLCNDYILNPMTFKKEWDELVSCGIQPDVWVDPTCRWSTPYDMMANQISEELRKDKLGSCGMGIWETVVRSSSTLTMSLPVFIGLTHDKQKEFLSRIRDSYLPKRLLATGKNEVDNKWIDLMKSDTLMEHFINDVIFMSKHIHFASASILNKYDNVVFEAGQGLLIGEQTKGVDWNHATPSNTGLGNASSIIKNNLPEADVEACYVSRTYLTRHGMGVMEDEQDKLLIIGNRNEPTNVTNEFQGSFRYGKLDVKSLIGRVNDDFSTNALPGWKKTIALTHNDEVVAPKVSKKDFNGAYVVSGRTNKDVVIK